MVEQGPRCFEPVTQAWSKTWDLEDVLIFMVSFFIKGSLAQKLPIYERHLSKVKSSRVVSSRVESSRVVSSRVVSSRVESSI